MCDERERLIGYVYDECDASERRAIEDHLTGCDVCRREIRGLRGVRQDLLAWSVPEHESVWRPMMPPKVESPWHAMPAWAMLAAASLILMVGAAGGAATYAFLPHERAVDRQASSATSGPNVPVATPTRTDEATVVALEQRIAALERVTNQMGPRLESIAARSGGPNGARLNAAPDDLAVRVNLLSRRQDELTDVVGNMYRETTSLRRMQNGLKENTNFLLTSLGGRPGGVQGFPQGLGGQ